MPANSTFIFSFHPLSFVLVNSVDTNSVRAELPWKQLDSGCFLTNGWIMHFFCRFEQFISRTKNYFIKEGKVIAWPEQASLFTKSTWFAGVWTNMCFPLGCPLFWKGWFCWRDAADFFQLLLILEGIAGWKMTPRFFLFFWKVSLI